MSKGSAREAEELKRKKRKRDEEELMAEFHETTFKKAKPNQVCYPPSASPRPPLTLRIAINSSALIELSGAYTIVAPQVSDGWGCDGPLTLQLAPSSTGAHLWGSFDFGVFEGTLRSHSALPAANNTVKFHWRGRETGEGETTYGPENIAEFEFLEGGKFSGTMYWDFSENLT
jgi:hypothetical protein